jgi:hypothetical protein
MGRVKIPYYVVVKGRGYWRPHPRMRPFGFNIIRCGPDGSDAWALAQSWNERWQAVRNRKAPPLIDTSKLAHDEAEAARRYPPGSVGAAFQIYIRTEEWAAKAYSNRVKVWWPAWYRIRDMWGDVAPDTISFEQISKWRAALERKHGRGVAHKTLKVWRSLWTIMRALKVARTVDPSRGVRNKAPLPRHQRWTEGEAVRLVKCAWRSGYRGLACIVAVCWDTQFSPVDGRTLRARHTAQDDGRLFFDRQEDGRTKTGRAAIGTLSKRTERLVATYLNALGVDLHPDAVLFRNKSGNPYREDSMAHDFADVRELAFPGDRRRLMDMRRSGVVEAIAGDAGPLALSAKLANSIQRSNALHRTYAPVDIEAVRSADEARLRGRKRIRGGNETGAKVSTQHPGRVSTLSQGDS